MKQCLILLLCVGTAIPAQAGLEDLLISEINIIPNSDEFIEIHNKGVDVIDLSDVYLTDATFSNGNVFYYQLVTGGGGGGGFSDFYARFPAGASITPGEYQTVSLSGSIDFFNAYGEQPTYELFEDAVSADGVPDMREAVTGSINDQGSLTDDSGEVVVLLYWDGATDLVQDLDYVVWGDKVEAIDKSGVAIDGPDGGADTTTYLADTAIAAQTAIATSAHASGNSWQRIDMTEGAESQSGGNGVAGSDEMSENTDFTFGEGVPTPNAATNIAPPVAQFVINEIDAVSNNADFIELFGNANTSTDGYTVVLYDGLNDEATAVISLDGMSTDANGYLLLNNALEDGADAVALYAADSMNFNMGDPITLTDLMDAIVYDSGQPDDAELLGLINVGQPQVNENANGNAMNESLIRCTNGSGGQLNTSSFKAFTPSPGAANLNCITFDGYYDSADDTNSDTLRLSLHQIIDDHVSYPYTSGSTDTWDVLSFADEDPNPAVDINPSISEKVWMVYRNISFDTETGGNSNYNREHTWPQSYGFADDVLGDDNTARTDAHHLMLSDINYNSSRGNKYFDYCDTGCNELVTVDYNGQGGGSGAYPGNSNWTNGTVFEVWNARKGDIARAMFYMDVRYDDLPGDPSGIPIGEVDLILTDDPNDINNDQPYMGLLSVLLAWHDFDPVDEIELLRNDEVFALQENRNPFVDHPEWVECIFVAGGKCTTNIDDLIFADDFE